MKNFPRILFSILQGAGIATAGMGFAKWGMYAPQWEGILFAVAAVFLTAALIIFSKYNLGSKLNPNITDPKMIAFLTKYPMVPAYVSMTGGIIIAYLLFRYLEKR